VPNVAADPVAPTAPKAASIPPRPATRTIVGVRAHLVRGLLATIAALPGPPLLAVPQAPTSATTADVVDYDRDVRPILSANCFACHGFDGHARKAGLRLDRAESAYAADADGATPIKPGDPAASEVWKRVASDDPDARMPPPSSHRELAAPQKEAIRRWIAQGAPYVRHWAFEPPRPSASAGSDAPPIDALVAARLASRGLTLSPPADRATLLRRATLDLTGLPPSADEVAAFVADPDPRAYENAVDRLLASPHFGERMALPWLDAARYADTNGFSIDGGRHLWLWRDYVVHAFNANKPYDRFLVEQIAGDLLPDRNDETLTATGFQRNAMITHEGGTIDEENLVNYGVDRVRTFGEAVLGLTIGCAQCHDHKFDPVSQRDYYRLFAFFNQTTEPAQGGDGGVNAPPTAKVGSTLVTGEEPALRARIAALEAALAAPDPAAFAAWESEERARLAARGAGLALRALKLLKLSTPNTGSGFEIAEGRYALVTRPMGHLAFDVSMELPPLERPITGLRVVMHPAPDAPDAGWGWHGGGPKRTFALTNVSVSVGATPSDQVNLYRLRELSGATASSWNETTDGFDRPEGVLDTPPSGWAPDPAAEGPVHLTATFATPLAPGEATHLTAQLNFGRGGNVAAKRMEFFAVTGRDDGSTLPPPILAAIEKDATARTSDERATLLAYFARRGAALSRTRIDLANARERLAVRTQAHSTMVMDTAPTTRPTFVLARGNYAAPGERVEAGTPEFLPPMPADAPRNRLGLARWVVDPRNPLAARVAVNRVWQTLFGAGLVRTANDFGLQGDWPEHRELLDALAADFRDRGWDVKRLVRLIATSDAYRRSSRATSEALARDPDNRLLARGPRFRLPAELLRDCALKTSGLLVDRLGGPSVNPYTPGDPWREISHYGSSSATAQTFVQDRGEKLYRRSLYTYWKRTLPPPNMAVFDAPNRELCTFERGSTNTPLQALVLLNDVQFVEAARAFAERALVRGGDDAAKLAWAFAETTSRAPNAEEAAVLTRALARERARFAADLAAARALLAHGESPRDERLPPAEHAAWTQVASTLLNLSEAVTRH
jgi:mono/diheme cytochrome c family protein